MHKKHLLIEGILAGVIVCEAVAIYRIRKTKGVLKIDQLKDKDNYCFEIDDLDELTRAKYITLKIERNTNLSHE